MKTTTLNINGSRNLIFLENDGQLIKETNYWDTPVARAGLYYLSSNAGAIRLLCPGNKQQEREMETGKEIVLTGGFHVDLGRKMVEVMFDDGSDSPFALWVPEGDRTFNGNNPCWVDFLIYRRDGLWKKTKAWLRAAATLPCLAPR